MSIATREQAVVDAVEKRLYIDGQWRDAGEGRTLSVEDPSTGEALCEVADATPSRRPGGPRRGRRQAARMGGDAGQSARRDPLARLRGTQRAGGRPRRC